MAFDSRDRMLPGQRKSHTLTTSQPNERVIDPGLTRYRVGRRFSLDSNRSRHVNV